ncbi:hypothetical protein SLEP1_g44760 [Rubroshorea leprosula]|uniref:Uncharacterized protein n=1 Tax=Rubroshorea leprosula TaxID=152421 RepID=A0AAV5LID5_9ROSI|nr:hypothetical protein SLEP1_g44760 [Rubroshorea leprosula]
MLIDCCEILEKNPVRLTMVLPIFEGCSHCSLRNYCL